MKLRMTIIEAKALNLKIVRQMSEGDIDLFKKEKLWLDRDLQWMKV